MVNLTTLNAVFLMTIGEIAITLNTHYSDVIMCAMACQITSLTIVYSTIYSGTDERKHQSSMSLAFVRVIHQWPVNSPPKGPVMRKMFPFGDVIMRKGYKNCKLDNYQGCCLDDHRWNYHNLWNENFWHRTWIIKIYCQSDKERFPEDETVINYHYNPDNHLIHLLISA